MTPARASHFRPTRFLQPHTRRRGGYTTAHWHAAGARLPPMARLTFSCQVLVEAGFLAGGAETSRSIVARSFDSTGQAEGASAPVLASRRDRPARPRRPRPRRPRLDALGTMNFGKRTPAAEAERIVARALERGVTFFDTANAYADGESERILGRALGGARDRVTAPPRSAPAASPARWRGSRARPSSGPSTRAWAASAWTTSTSTTFTSPITPSRWRRRSRRWRT